MIFFKKILFSQEMLINIPRGGPRYQASGSTSLWGLDGDSTKLIWSDQPGWMESIVSFKMLLVLLAHGTDLHTKAGPRRSHHWVSSAAEPEAGSFQQHRMGTSNLSGVMPLQPAQTVSVKT